MSVMMWLKLLVCCLFVVIIKIKYHNFEFYLETAGFVNKFSIDNATVDFSKNQLIEYDETYTYNVSHKKRGIALIFNHELFDKNPEKNRRLGTEKDKTDLINVLTKLNFDVMPYDNLNIEKTKEVLKEVASMDHSQNDCLVVVVMSHGRNGEIYARDDYYATDILSEPFRGDNCKSLAGKPKLFFIQACRGNKTDAGFDLQRDTAVTDSEIGKTFYRLPIMADILIMYATPEGYCSWRSGENGTWFIQSLCTELELNGSKMELLSLLTHVTRRVAIDHETSESKDPEKHKKKQVSVIVSMLTKDMYFPPKQIEEPEELITDSSKIVNRANHEL